jgi:hypothetical protein
MTYSANSIKTFLIFLEKVVNGGSPFMVKVTWHGKHCAVEWVENTKAKTKKKSKTSMACEALFKNHVYNKEFHFGRDFFCVDVNEQLFPYAGAISGYRGEGTSAVIVHSMKEEPNSYFWKFSAPKLGNT